MDSEGVHAAAKASLIHEEDGRRQCLLSGFLRVVICRTRRFVATLLPGAQHTENGCDVSGIETDPCARQRRNVLQVTDILSIDLSSVLAARVSPNGSTSQTNMSGQMHICFLCPISRARCVTRDVCELVGVASSKWVGDSLVSVILCLRPSLEH